MPDNDWPGNDWPPDWLRWPECMHPPRLTPAEVAYVKKRMDYFAKTISVASSFNRTWDHEYKEGECLISSTRGPKSS